jgi:hypothetical protein
MSGKGERSPAHPPLRTYVRLTPHTAQARAALACQGMLSGRHGGARVRVQRHHACPPARGFQDRFRWHRCPSRSPRGVFESLPFTGADTLPSRPAPAGSLQPFGSWQTPSHCPARYRRAFASSRTLCPQRRRSPSRVRYPSFGGSATGLPSSAACISSPAALGAAYGPGASCPLRRRALQPASAHPRGERASPFRSLAYYDPSTGGSRSSP